MSNGGGGSGGGLDTSLNKDDCNNEMKDADPVSIAEVEEAPEAEAAAGETPDAKPPIAPPRARRGLAATKAAKAKLQGRKRTRFTNGVASISQRGGNKSV